MVDIAGQGRTVLLASHQIAEVERVADVVAILRDGKLALVERLDELKTHVCELTITLRDGSANCRRCRERCCIGSSRGGSGGSWCGTSMSRGWRSSAPNRKWATSKCGTRRWKRSSWAT